MTEENDKYFEHSTKCWICDHAHVDGEVKVRDNCHHWKIKRLCA